MNASFFSRQRKKQSREHFPVKRQIWPTEKRKMAPPVFALQAFLVGLLLLHGATAGSEPYSEVSYEFQALAVLRPTAGSTASGNVTIFQTDAVVGDNFLVQVSLTGLSPGSSHGLHFHAYGDVTDADSGGSLYGHFNPTSKPHGCPGGNVTALDIHTGDLGTVTADSDGQVTATFRRHLTGAPGDPTLTPGALGWLLGRGVVLHQNVDDCKTQPSGNSGKRLAVGVVGWKSGTAIPKILTEGDAVDVGGDAKKYAIAVLSSVNSTITGVAYFEQATNEDKVVVRVELSGMASGSEHGVHLHLYGDVSDTIAGMTVGGHFNPFNQSHGCPGAGGFAIHSGDLGNVVADESGKGTLHLESNLTTLWPGHIHTITGRAVSVHGGKDDCITPPAGNAGGRAAIGVIGVRNGTELTSDSSGKTTASGTPTASTTATSQELQTSTPAKPTEASFPYVALALLKPTANNSAMGLVTISQSEDLLKLIINVDLEGLNPGSSHGFHIHAFGDVTDHDSGTSLYGHFNPTNKSHGCVSESVGPLDVHSGDLGIVTADNSGIVRQSFTRNLTGAPGDLTLQPGALGWLLGRGVVLHQNVDDCKTQPTGNAGTRLAIGVIGWKNATKIPEPLVAGVAVDNGGVKKRYAVSVLSSINSTVAGIAYFEQDAKEDNVQIKVYLSGMKSGSTHGVHIHVYGDVSDSVAGMTIGSHFNPFAQPHSCPAEGKFALHSGDLGNIQANESGQGSLHLESNLTSLWPGDARTIVGRAVSVHQGQDDCVTQPTGNSGGRAAIGVIGVRNGTEPSVQTTLSASSSVASSVAIPTTSTVSMSGMSKSTGSDPASNVSGQSTTMPTPSPAGTSSIHSSEDGAYSADATSGGQSLLDAAAGGSSSSSSSSSGYGQSRTASAAGESATGKPAAAETKGKPCAPSAASM
ncbi:Copper/zinc superoxide dismutase-domain-containing protein [Zopfochytrium polystomum]|nr:Copper/zinc superoxide dismutase-domain-containing protein [Zopfochytrium polystomum]